MRTDDTKSIADTRQHVMQFIEKHHLLAPGQRVLAALSGGADSVMLLRLLHGEGYYIEAAHCNFRLRGSESERDEEFVGQLCHSLGIRLHVTRFDTATYAHNHGISIEMAARQLRYQYFEQLRTERHMDAVAVAHHRDDNVETLLLNLIRGTGLKGMTAMQPRNGHIIRPLLCLSRADITAYLDRIGQSYMTDSTNLTDVYSRNKIRLDVMPLLRSINPAADANISNAIENLQEAYKVYAASIEQMAAECLDRQERAPGTTTGETTTTHTLYINIERLHKCSSPLSVLHHLLSPLGFNRRQMAEMLEPHAVGSQFNSATHRLIADRSHLIVALAASEPEAPTPLSKFDGIRCTRVMASELTIEPDPRRAYIDSSTLSGELTVRRVRKADAFRPFGMKGRKLVSDLLTDLKLNRIEKEEQLVVCDSDEIVWVVGRRSSEKHKITSTTKEVIVMEKLY
ncbi:MAG: tRNA lysidine(34) synthetase TilS [Bacteroidaceae bacterium]|nr:tRNA lysidine(34) synthetase TilS [Bacteroidaceae bacterium]